MGSYKALVKRRVNAVYSFSNRSNLEKPHLKYHIKYVPQGLLIQLMESSSIQAT